MFVKNKAAPFDLCWTENTDTGCHEWIRSLDRKGYPNKIWINKGRIRPTRYSIERAKGPLPIGMVVCHHCDNPRCINPDHLFFGTDADNTLDKCKKQRQARGVTNGNRKFNEVDIERVRDLAKFVSQKEISAYLGISQPTVSQIVRRETWRHI